MAAGRPGSTLHDMSAAGFRRLMYAVDAVVAGLLTVMWMVEVRDETFDSTALETGAYLLALGASAPFAVRRLAPRLVFGVMAACFGLALLGGIASTGVGVAFAAYTVLVRHDRRVGGVVIAVGYALIVLAYLVLPDTTLSTFFLDAITFAMVIALAELVKTRRAYAEIYERAGGPARAGARHPRPEGRRRGAAAHRARAARRRRPHDQSDRGPEQRGPGPAQDGAGRHRPGAGHHRDEQPRSAGGDAPDAGDPATGRRRPGAARPGIGPVRPARPAERGVLDRRRRHGWSSTASGRPPSRRASTCAATASSRRR